MSAPTRISLKLLYALLMFFLLGCEEEEAWLKDPTPYLETAAFPGYFRNIPLFGIDGHNGLKPPEKGTHCSAYGVYVCSGSRYFLRSLNDSVIFHVPLSRDLPYPSEKSAVQVEGEAMLSGFPLLGDVAVIAVVEYPDIYAKAMNAYPGIMEKIRERLDNPKSKLDLTSIETLHCAASGDRLLIYGRTYDLMYEFDLGFLFVNENGSFKLRRIFAHHFFKGE
jgi:hypothetical protein